ncbi:MAG: chromate transporter [Bacteroidales bacterium]|jgi:chromate transporter|nr:chromate transporter [Bacteroidales bacterium]
MIFFSLFWSFFKIGLFGFGGGYAILSMIQHEICVKHQWIDAAQFSEIIAISQTTPGPIGINCATYTGYIATYSVYQSEFTGILGSVLASIALCLPSILMIWFLLSLLSKHRENLFVKNIFFILRPVVVGLIFSAAIMLITPETFVDYKSILICVVTFLVLMFFKKVSPILLIVLSGVVGYLIY